jgi:hypoxanthine phosphoribosyltransferase
VLCVPILKGAFIFAADLMRNFKFKFEVDFLNCSSYGSSTESCGRVDLLSPLRTAVRGRHVLLIEDLIDSGTRYDTTLTTH